MPGQETKQFRLTAIHIIGSLLFLSLPILVMPEEFNGFSDFFSRSNSKRDLIHYILLLGFFYLNYYLLVPEFYFRRRYFLYLFFVLICFLIIAFTPGLFIPFDQLPPFGPPPGPGPPMDSDWNWIFKRINHNFFLFLAVLFLSLFMRVGTRWQESEKEKLDAEIAYLKSQINPHFLFNTLNNIYSLAIQKSDQTATAVARLSEMMRYVLYESNKEWVPLEKELEYISDYIELQRMRFGEGVSIHFDMKGDGAGKKIIPLALIPFIENAFKYGVNAEENATVSIQVSIAGNVVDMKVENQKVNKPNRDTESGGIGIVNTKERLQWMYPGRHKLEIKETRTDYKVYLEITLQ